MLVLGIESSCDECAAAVVESPAVEEATGEASRTSLLGQRVATQIPIHAPYGGVVPELASRDHVLKITRVIGEALKQAEVKAAQIDGIGVTAGPGLIGSLLVGVSAAKSLAWSLGKRLVGIHHLEAHLHSVFLERPDFAYPHLGLVVSGGHTSLVRVDGVGRLRVLGRTLDDAAGEALDKVAKLLGLEYPGGVSIQREAAGGDSAAIRFPRPLPGKRLDFSFSGLKTSACVRVKREGLPAGKDLKDFCASFQEAVVEVLVTKTILAARKERLERVLVAGGVAANSRLRRLMQQRAAEEDIEVCFPEVELCTDNAAMVAVLAAAYLRMGRFDGMELDADAGLAWPGT